MNVKPHHSRLISLLQLQEEAVEDLELETMHPIYSPMVG